VLGQEIGELSDGHLLVAARAGERARPVRIIFSQSSRAKRFVSMAVLEDFDDTSFGESSERGRAVGWSRKGRA
jgi:hypothetical protein